MLSRFRITAEVIVSKIFPAGFCWQGASVLAEHLEMPTDSLAFALTTGIGDGLGVLGGHILFYSFAKKIYLPNVNLIEESDKAIMLGTAALFSGTVWQPTVNLCHYLDLGFTASAFGTMAVCGTAFFTGLKLSRKLYSKHLKFIEPNTKKNNITDTQLSLSIGGATGAFVGTDLTFYNNWLGNYFGINNNINTLSGMIIAGKSTSLGFGFIQSIQNLTIGKNLLWNDIKM